MMLLLRGRAAQFGLLATAAAFLSPIPVGAAATTLPPAPMGVTIQTDVAYLSPDRSEKLDLYLPAGRAPAMVSPGIVIIHGGGWTGGTKSASREFEIGTTLAKAGYVCASVEYRMSSHERWPTNVYDCKNAVRFLRKNADRYGVDVNHIGVIGGSAGGHLSLMVAFTSGVAALEPPTPYPGISDKVQACVDMYGISDVRTREKTAPDGTPTGVVVESNAVFGDHAPITDADKALASPVNFISSDLPPVLILHGTRDTTVDRKQSIDLDKKLTEANVPHQLIWVKGAGHTFDLETWNRKPLSMDLRPIVVGFFDKYLKSETKP